MSDPTVESETRSATDRGASVSGGHWKVAVRSVVVHARDHQLSLIGAGVAFFAMLSIAPAMVAVVSVYGLVASPAEVSRQINDLGATMPAEARQLLTDQLQQVVRSSSTGLGVALAVGVAIALWSASSAVKQLLVAMSAVYDVVETRRFARLRGRAALLTLGAIAFVVATLLVLTVVPRWIGESVGDGGRAVVAVVRWPLLAAMMLGVLAVVYRYGPDRPRGRWQWWTWGAGIAAASWLAASALFSAYVTHFGSYNKTYGALAAVVVLMLWLYLSVLCVLLGGEINAELDRRRVAIRHESGSPAQTDL
ncbi:MAG TPA: YihY/virulence factor BrkB family protein [Dermatophilaceae bacterium]